MLQVIDVGLGRECTPQERACIADAARGAVKVIEAHGWVQGAFGDRAIGYCMIGAIKEQCKNQLITKYNTTYALGEWLRTVGPPLHPQLSSPSVVMEFNDSPGRTREEVLLHLNKFADEVDPR